MKKEALEIVRGSGNVFEGFGYPDADVRQAKALMGAQIIKILDRKGSSTRQAEAKTGISHSEFSRIRRASFSRFTIDRLMAIHVSIDAQYWAPIDRPIRRAPTARPTG